MKKRRILFFFILLLFLTLFCGCSKREISSVQIQKNSFKTSYEVDEKIDLSASYLLIVYSSGDTETVPITEEMISGFDTSTTGNKTLSVTYKDHTSESVSYRVYNPENASREIVTNARLFLFADEGTDYIDYTVRISTGELKISAVDFTLKSDNTLGIHPDLGNVTFHSDDVTASVQAKISSAETELRVLTFHENNRTFVDGSILVRIRVSGGKNHSVRLTSITVSDGQQDYYLPLAA